MDEFDKMARAIQNTAMATHQSNDEYMKVQFRVGIDLEPEVAARMAKDSQPRDIIRRDIERYYKLIKHEVIALRLRGDNAEYLLKTLRHRSFDPSNVVEIIVGIMGDDPNPLCQQLRRLTVTGRTALCDALERAQLHMESGKTPKEAARRAGLSLAA